MISINEGNQLDAPSHIVLLYLNIECQYQTVIKSVTAPSNNITCLLWILQLQLLTVLLFLLVSAVIGDINANNFSGSVVTKNIDARNHPSHLTLILVPQFILDIEFFPAFPRGPTLACLLMHCTLSSRFPPCFFFLPFFLYKNAKLQTGARKIELPRQQHFSNSLFIWPEKRPYHLNSAGSLITGLSRYAGQACFTLGWLALVSESMLSNCFSPNYKLSLSAYNMEFPKQSAKK